MRRWRTRRDGESEEFPGFADVRPIGEGGFSTVFSARELAANRVVALKLLRVAPEVSQHAVECFQRETLALGALSAHPHILTLYRSFATADGRPVLVLELCSSSAARRLQEDGPLSAQGAVALGIKVAGALETAHRAGMLHRDVKPQNILLSQYGEPALADFGVAHLQDRGPATGGVVAFTTLHAAPELLEGGVPTAATDVYGLASTLYELVSGAPAFRAFEGESPASVALRVLRDPVSPLLSVPLALSDLLVGAMAKAPTARPASALAFADALAGIARALGWPTTRCVLATAAPGAPGVPPPPAPPAQATPERAAERSIAVTLERRPSAAPRPLERPPVGVVAPRAAPRRVLTPTPKRRGVAARDAGRDGGRDASPPPPEPAPAPDALGGTTPPWGVVVPGGEHDRGRGALPGGGYAIDPLEDTVLRPPAKDGSPPAAAPAIPPTVAPARRRRWRRSARE